MRKFSYVVIPALLAVLCVIPAMADQLTLGATSGNVYFCSPVGATTVTVAATSFTNTTNCTGETAGTVSGGGYFEAPNGSPLFLGTYTIGFPVPPLVLGPEGGSGQFPANAAISSFSWTGAGGQGSLAGTIVWNYIVDHTAFPKFDGNLTVTSVSGTNPIFTSDFPANGTVTHVDFTMGNLGVFFDAIRGTGTQRSATISSGEVVPTPEVSSVLLLGTGMLLAGTFVRYRRRRQA